jgi:hypothetical protein
MDLAELQPAVSMSGDELVAALDAVHATRAQLDSYELQLIARLHEIGYAQEVGAHDTTRFMATRYRVDTGVVRRKVDLATALHKYPVVAAALADPFAATSPDGTIQYAEASGTDGACDCEGDGNGDGRCSCGSGVLPVLLHLEQVRVIVEALESIPATAMVPVEDLRVAEEELVKTGRHLSPSDLRKLGSRVRDRLDQDGPEPAEDKARQREALRLTNSEGGVKFSGFLAAENAELFRGAIRAGSKPHKTVDGELDPRPRDKRQADALTDILHTATAIGDLPANGGVKPHITVTIDLDDLIQAGKHSTGDLTYGTGLSASAVRRLACDAGIIPMILGSDSQPLDVGREQRFVTGPIRAALIHRDKGCVVCGAPPIFCDAHHLVSWLDGGRTCLSNLVLLCRVHHIGLHQGHWKVTITDDIVEVTRPAWAEPDRRKRLTRIGAGPPSSRPARAWPLTGDTARRAPNEVARPNPWGDDPADPTSGEAMRPDPWDAEPAGPTSGEVARLNPRGEEPADPTSGEAMCLDPWGDEPASRTSGEAVRLDLWGDEASVSTSGEGTRVDPWGDESAAPTPAA